MNKTLTSLAFIATAMTALSLPASAAIPQMNGMVVSSANNATRPGLWSLPQEANGVWNMLFPIDPGYHTIYTGVLNEDENIYYESRCNAQYGTTSVYIDAFSMETGTKLWTDYLFDTKYLPYDLTYNPYDGRIYGIFSNSANTGIVLANITYSQNANVLEPIKELEGNWVAIAAAADGQLYGIASVVEGLDGDGIPVVLSSSLYKINRTTGETTLIGETGQKPLLTGSATIDPKSGRMFWSVAPDGISSYLCEVDLTTGAATKLFDFESNRQVTGMYVVTPPAEDGAPAQVSDVKADFNGGSLSGTLSFKSPTTLYDGTPATGSINYNILCKGVEIASGTTSFGKENNVNISVDEPGDYTFTITVSNETGRSPKVNFDKYIGFGVPKAPENVVATLSGNKINVSWNAVTEAVDNGYINGTEIKYTVVSMPDNQIVADAVSGNSITIDTDNDGPLKSFYYEVNANNNGRLSEKASSNHVVTGYASAPWSESFDSESAAHFFKIINSNNDDETWFFYTDRMRIKYSTSPMDDWLVTPPVKLNANYSYKFTFKARASNSNYPERVEVKYGTGNSAADMTISVIPSTNITSDEYVTLEGFLNPSQSGLYYIGIHGISDADMYNLEIDDIYIGEGLNLAAPAEPDEFSVVGDNTGLPKATVTLKAPTKTIGGENMTALTKVVVKRGDTIVKEFANPTPGETLTFVDTPEVYGNITYQAIAYNEAGEGRAASCVAFVGTPLAVAPENLVLAEPENGKVTLSWSPVSKSAEGKDINPERVLYNVYDVYNESSPVLVADSIAATTYSLTAVTNNSQKMVKYAVTAVTDGGESEKANTDIVPVGVPYSNFSESFANGVASTIYVAERLNFGNWAPSADTGDVVSQDGDGGYLTMTAYFAGYNGAFKTGKIDLAGMSAPVLSFYTYNPDNERADLNPIRVSVCTENGEWIQVFDKTVTEIGAKQGWHEVVIPLNDFVGKVVRLNFFAETSTRPYTVTYFDNIRVIQQNPVELQVSSVEAPTHVRTGDDFAINVNLKNNGSASASDYKVEIYAGDNLCVETETVPSIESMQSVKIPLNLKMSPFSEAGSIVYKAVVSHPGDNKSDNNSFELNIVAMRSNNPAPQNLSGYSRENAVELSWQAPVLESEAPEAVTDGFENATPWAHNAPDWAFIDRDLSPVISFVGYEFPGVTAGKTTSSFITFSATDIFEGNTYLMPHNGKQYLVGLARYDGGTVDDWAISPELCGDAQTVSFFAKSYHKDYPERFEVYYSTGSFNPDDFVKTNLTVENVPDQWTEYKVDLPKGARYFAIRSCGTDSFMLMLDDATYKPASSHNIELLGYNVYRDNVKVNESLVAVPAYTDNVENAENHSWIVTAVYDRGESQGSNVLSNVGAGIGEISADFRVYAHDCTIFVTGVEGRLVSIASTDGRLVYNSTPGSSLAIDVTPGIYIVSVGGKASKILVK